MKLTLTRKWRINTKMKSNFQAAVPFCGRDQRDIYRRPLVVATRWVARQR
jgi:hypothetical protein